MKRSNEYNLKDAINAMIKENGLKEKLDETKIISIWEKLMGPAVGKHTKKIFLRDKKLFLYLDSAPLKNELLYTRSKIVERLNEEAGENVIEEVVIR